MGDPTNAVEINVVELSSHQQRLGGLVDRVSTARDAASTVMSPDAFGVFGGLMGLADGCAQAEREGADTLQVALDASRDHHQKVGAWVSDLDTNELNIADMFKVIGEDHDR